MNREIGSIFQINREDFGYGNSLLLDLVKQALQAGYQDSCAVSSGRDALIMAICQIEKDRQKKETDITCMLPMFTCDSVDAPFDFYGWKIHYYPIGKNLQPDVEVFSQMLQRLQPDVVLLHSYFGQDTVQEIRPILNQKQKDGLIVIEDLTQTLYMDLDFSADFYVMSLRKWMGIPDGGLILSKQQLSYKPHFERAEFVRKKWIALTDKYDYLEMITEESYDKLQQMKKEFLKQNLKAEEILDEDKEICTMSKMSMYLWNKKNLAADRVKRAENAAFLYQQLQGISWLTLPLEYTKEQAPLYFPVSLKDALDRPRLQEYLQQQEIYAPVLWPVSERIAHVEENTAYLYEHLLALPCDQRYDTRDMKRMADCIRGWR